MKTIASFLTIVLVALFSLLITSTSHANQWLDGRVIRVIDGDTIVLNDKNGTQHTIRLDQIDAPERKQPYYRKSLTTLRKLIDRKNVRVQIHNSDRYGRLIGTVYLHNSNVNLYMVRSGMAWAYPHYVRNAYYFEAESLAREEEKGMWSSPVELTAPWDFRREQQEQKDIQIETFDVQ